MRRSIPTLWVCGALVGALSLGCASSRQVGTGMLIGGAVLAAGGAVATGVGLSCREAAGPDGQSEKSCAGNPVTYGGLGALGAGVFVGGIGLSVVEMSPPATKKPK